MSSASRTIDDNEIANFTKDSDHWWDVNGPFKPLHKLNPERISYIKQHILNHFSCESLKDINILDIGCGGGLVCEPLTRLGANVTGVDADSKAIEVAQNHANDHGLNLNYINKPIEDISEQFDVILALEILEHVSDVEVFIAECTNLLKPGGLIIFSTLNRTPKSFALGIVAAEYLLRWVPRGTHDWNKFLKPSELAKVIRQNNLQKVDMMGLHYDPIEDTFSLTPNKTQVNYFLSACKPKD